MRRWQWEGTEEGSDRDKLCQQRGVEGGEVDFWTTWGDTSRTFCDEFCVQFGHLGSSGLDYTSLVTQL